MASFMTVSQRKAYMDYADAWLHCNYWGIIRSNVDRINDVDMHLAKLEVPDLTSYLLIDEKTKAFVYKADLGRGSLIDIIEIYYGWNPRSTEWRKRNAQFALHLDEDLINGLDDGVAVPKFVVPFASTALEEVMIIRY